MIKKFRSWTDMLLPDRGQVTMTVPFMRAYTELLVKTCHKRGAYAIGGMAAFIPSRRDAEVNAIAMARVKEDKQREASDGFDGTWVAHPDLVPIATRGLRRRAGRAAQPARSQAAPGGQRHAPTTCSTSRAPAGRSPRPACAHNISVGIQYIESWLLGVGAAAIFNLMEDAATAEISRSQIWQWIHHGAKLEDGRPVTKELVRQIMDEELAKLPYGEEGRFQPTRARSSSRSRWRRLCRLPHLARPTTSSPDEY